MTINITNGTVYRQNDGSGALVEDAPPPTGDSGGTPEFAWSAPGGLANGNSITVTSSTQTFAQPEKQIFLGFGMGWLQSQSDGTPFADITVGSESFEYEDAPGSERRFVQTVNGVKVLRSFLRQSGTDLPAAGGMINWDTGAELTPTRNAYMFSRARCTVATSPNTQLQWKQDRIRVDRNFDGIDQNTIYITETGTGDGSWKRVNTTGSGADKGFETQTPTHNGKWNSFGFVWKPNTPDASDGDIYAHSFETGDTGFLRDRPQNSDTTYPVSVISSGSAARPRWVMNQDYIGNNTTARDITIERTDMYWKVNGDLFLLADSDNLANCTDHPIPLVPTSFNGSSSWTFNLWLGLMTSYTGKYIHRLDNMLNPLQVVAL